MFNFIKTRTQKQARTQRIYTAIKNMKDIFSEGFECSDPTTGEIIGMSCFMHDLPAKTGLTIYDYCKFLQTKYNKLTTITDKIAFLTVLSLWDAFRMIQMMRLIQLFILLQHLIV